METEVSAARTVCVVGFHRSGTSLTARVLNMLGVGLGDESELLPAEENDNPRGYWEPRWMIDLNDELLAHFGVSWWHSFPAEPGWEQRPELASLLERARTLFAEKLGDIPLRGFKDPRTTLTLPFWRQVVPDLHYVICLRNPIDAVASLQRRPEPTRSVQEWGELWTEYTARALMETVGKPRQLVFYEDYFQNGRATIGQLAAFIGAPLTADDPRWDRALPLVEQDLRHHSTSPRELAAIPGAPVVARALFLALRAGHELRGDATTSASPLSEAIERLAPELWWADVQASQARILTKERTGELAVAQRALAEVRNEFVAAQRTLNDTQSQLEQQARTADGASARERALLDRLAATEQEVSRARDAISQLESSLSWRMTVPLRTAKRRLSRAHR